MSDKVPRNGSSVRGLSELTPGEMARAGGKGASLARLLAAGLPVPAGFVVLPSGFTGGSLSPDAREQVLMHLASLRGADAAAAFAVRSSALGEDSAAASFAGQFTTVLDVRTDEAVLAAIARVYGSRQNARGAAYGEAHGLSEPVEIAVVVQQLIPAE